MAIDVFVDTVAALAKEVGALLGLVVDLESYADVPKAAVFFAPCHAHWTDDETLAVFHLFLPSDSFQDIVKHFHNFSRAGFSHVTPGLQVDTNTLKENLSVNKVNGRKDRVKMHVLVRLINQALYLMSSKGLVSVICVVVPLRNNKVHNLLPPTYAAPLQSP